MNFFFAYVETNCIRIAAPSAAPANVNCATISANSIQVSWSQPIDDQHNGVLQGYRIFYKLINAQGMDTFHIDSKRVGNVQDTVLHGLRAFQNYSIRISPINRAGNGPLSTTISCQTDEDGNKTRTSTSQLSSFE